MGDGSYASMQQIDQAILQFCKKLVGALAPVPLVGPTTWLLTRNRHAIQFCRESKVSRSWSKDSFVAGRPADDKSDRAILLAPNNGQDYQVAAELAGSGVPTIIVNALAKDAKSIPSTATMAYFLKPLTYNSQVAGYLIRQWPKPWSVLDAASSKMLGTYDDDDILVANTNTPDLRASVKLVQKAADERAIQSRLR